MCYVFRMAGVFDIDLETEDISDTEVSLSLASLTARKCFDGITLTSFFCLQDDACELTVVEPDR